MGGGKERQTPPPRITPLPPPRAASPISNETRDKRADWDEKYDRMYAAEEPEPITAERKTTEVWLNRDGLGARVTRQLESRIFELEGQPRLDFINAMWTGYIWPKPDEIKRLPVHFGSVAKGDLRVSRSAGGQLATHGTNLLLFNHPNLPYLGTSRNPMLLIEVDQSVIKGRVVLTTGPQVRAFTELDAAGAREILGLDDLHELTTGEVTNELTNGTLKFELAQLAYKLQGVFPGEGNFTLANGFTGDAEIEAKGIDPQRIPIRRDTHGALSAHAPVKGTLHARGENIDAKLIATFSRGKFDIDGTLTYAGSIDSPAVNGVVKVRLTDLATARDAVRRRLGKYAPSDPESDAAPNGLALWGEGQVDFRLNKWLTGRALVVADPDGFVTVIGELRPTAKIQVFEEWTPDLGKYFKAAGEMVQLIDKISTTPIGVGGKVNLTAKGGIGPGTIEDIEVDGVFSTYPKDRLPTQFSITGTFVVPASVSLTLSVGLEISAAGIVGAGIRGKGTATLTARGAVTPKFGLEKPPGGGEPLFFIAGRLTAQARLDLAVSIECYAKIDTPFWSDEVSYPLVDTTFRLGSTSLAVQGKYFLGGDSKPSDLDYDINTAPGGGHDGFNNQKLSRKAVHQEWDSAGQTAPKSTWQPDSYRAAKHVNDVTPSQEASDSAVSTEALAAGGTEAPAVAPEQVPPSPAAPPVAIAAAPSIGGGGSPPPTPPPPPPPDPTSPVRVEFMMLTNQHALVLNREPPASVVIEPADELLRYSLNQAEVSLERLLTRPLTKGARSPEDLSSELSYVRRVQDEAQQVETRVRELADPFEARAETAGLDVLADSIESYGRLFQRWALVDLSATNNRSTTAPLTLPPAYANSADALSLEQAEPGRVTRLIQDHGRYVSTFYTTGRKKPTQTPMDERPYVEMRARFILGMQVETPILELYNRLMSSTIGVSVTKNNRTVDILDRNGVKERGRRPDFFHLGKVIGDVKNVGTQTFSDQMIDNFRIADADAVRVPAGIAGAGSRRVLGTTDKTPRVDLIVRVPWHPRGPTVVAQDLVDEIKIRNGDILELIDDPII